MVTDHIDGPITETNTKIKIIEGKDKNISPNLMINTSQIFL